MKKKWMALALASALAFFTSFGSLDVQAQETVSANGSETTAVTESAETAAVTESTATTEAAATTGFRYQHDPRENPKAMADIVENPAAVYGFSPSPDSKRLASFLSFDWTDPAVVEKGRQDRIKYHESLGEMYAIVKDMKARGCTTEEIARAVSTKRNEIRFLSNSDDPEKAAAAKASNLATYGNEMGPTPEYLYEKYGSWETVMEKSFSVNSGMDACLGLYDDYYELYVTIGQVPAPQKLTYVVQSGDCLMGIARKMLGDANQWKEIYQQNQSIIRDANVIYKGQVLEMP